MADLINATTAAAQSSGFTVADGVAVTIMATSGALGLTEAVMVEVQDGASNWIRFGADDDAVMDHRRRVMQINGPGIFRVRKTATQNAVGAFALGAYSI